LIDERRLTKRLSFDQVSVIPMIRIPETLVREMNKTRLIALQPARVYAQPSEQ
jgi:hypothetical protein